VGLNARFGSSNRRNSGSNDVRLATEATKPADEVSGLRTFKQATDGYPLLGQRAE